MGDNNEKIFAFEAKAATEKHFTTRLLYSIPEWYITQTMLEGKVSNAKREPLYLCWTPENMSVFIVPGNEDTEKQSTITIDNIYHCKVPNIYHCKVPKRLSHLLKEIQLLKQSINEHILNCVFVGEFPLVRASALSLQAVAVNGNFETTCTFDDLIQSLLKARKTTEEAYNLQRKISSQVVVYLLADLNRLWKP